ncbi:Dienelactone hydrolase family protein [compost metagenome]
MGGAIALRAAARHPERVVGAASFHGGHLASDSPMSPHRLADRIKAELYIGHAKDDPSCPTEQVERLEAALDAAGVCHQTEIYEAAHGWTMPDLPWAYDEAAAEKAWGRLYDLLDRTLK